MLPRAQESSHLLVLGHGSKSVAMKSVLFETRKGFDTVANSAFIAPRFKAQKPSMKNAKPNTFHLYNEQ